MRLAIDDTQWNLHFDGEDSPLAQSLSSLDRAFDLDGPCVSPGLFCHVVKWHCGGRNFYVKRYQPRGKHSAKAFGTDRANVEYGNYAYFARMGIPTPRVVAHGSQYKLGLWRRGVIITEEVPHATDLQTLAHARPSLFEDQQWLSHVMRLLAGHVRRLHEDGFAHRDLKWRNILVTAEETPRLFFLDCPSGRRPSFLSFRHCIVRDLAHLDRSARQYLSRTMRLRFYLWYRRQRHLTPRDKEVIGRVVAYRPRRRRLSVRHSLNLWLTGFR